MAAVQQQQQPQPQEVLREALAGIQREAPKRLKELRDECQADLERLGQAGSPAPADFSAEEYFKALKLALEATGCQKVVLTSLECIQKLIKEGHLVGKGPDPFKQAEGGTARCLMDNIVESICSCAEQPDEHVQARQMQALLRAITAQSCEVHGTSLKLALDTIFKIFRDTKSPNNLKTAQACLNQIINTVMQRMELSGPDTSRRSPSAEEQNDSKIKAQQNADLQLLPPGKLLNDWMTSYVGQLVDKVVLEHGKEGRDTEDRGKFGFCVVCRKKAEHYCLVTKDPIFSKTCKFRNLERQQLVERTFPGSKAEAGIAAQGVATTDGAAPPGEAQTTAAADTTGKGEATATTTTTAEAAATTTSSVGATVEVNADGVQDLDDKAQTPIQRDVLMAFSFLCELSNKEVPPAPNDQKTIKSKKMALELIHQLLSNCGPVVKSNERFIGQLKKTLCPALVQNSVSPVPKIFGLALSIFVILITNFKEHLRTEIGVFIEQILLRILESGNSTHAHKNRVLNVFYKLCTDASTALELFLNFDCDVDEKNIFERMVDCLSKIAQGKYTSVEHANLIQPHQEQELKAMALKALVTLMGSLVDWSTRMTEDKEKAPKELPNGEEKAEESDGEEDAQSEGTHATSGGHSQAAISQTTVTCLSTSAITASKQRKMELQIGVNKFNMKPKRGIEYLKQNGFVSDDPKEVADLFLKGDLGLDKTQIGDYLGEDKPFNKAILYALVDSRDFRGQELDASLRNFLSVFRLPGEAQKIDRMMEKFAEKYCQDNPGVFANADCAFVLSFSLIMLQTDLHNPGVKNKMTKDEFIRNNRGINDNQDLPREILETLYINTAANPMSLKEDQDTKHRLETQAAQSAAQKQELFVRESEGIVLKSQEMMLKRTQAKSRTYVAAQSVQHVRPLFEVACWPYLATLAVLLEMSDDKDCINSCIEGFKHCIRIAARFDMDTERDAFVSSLAKFTYLATVKEMRQKNIDCIKALLEMGKSEGNNLGPSWQFVLLCISQLQRLELIGSHSKQDFLFFSGENEAESSPQGQAKREFSTAGGQVVKRRAHGLGVSALVSLGTDDRQVEQSNSDAIVSQIDIAEMDSLFHRSTNLHTGAILQFVTQLARVSKEELALTDQPRIFSLQKLVEVASYNMNRARLDWQKIWKVLSAHFVEVAGHVNDNVSMYAIDSLRQLSMKFLEKDELSGYNFQADFLHPFEVLMVASSSSPKVKGYVVQIMADMVSRKMRTIKSGWKTVFHILKSAATECKETVEVAFESMQDVVKNHYEILVENFNDGIQVLLAFAQCKVSNSASEQAIDHLLRAAEYLADRSRPQPPPDAEESQESAELAAASGLSRHPAEHWLHILRGLSTLVGDERREVRAKALNGLFDCLQQHGRGIFDEDTWRMVFNGVIKPLFDDIHHQLQPGDDRKKEGGANAGGAEGNAPSWAASTAANNMGRATCLQALTALVRLFEAHLEALSFLLDDVLQLIKGCICHDTEAVARIGVEGFRQLLMVTGKKLSPDCWSKVTVCLLQLFQGSMPTKLMCVEVNASDNDELPFRKDDVVIQCVVQLFLIDLLKDTVTQHYEHIPPNGIITLLDALQQSFEFAQEFNQKIELRQTLKRLGFIREMRQLPGLLKQEREALSCSLKVLFQVQADPRMMDSEHHAKAVERLRRLCSMVLRNYVNKEKILMEQVDQQPQPDQEDGKAQEREAATVEMERELNGLVPIISEVVLKGLKDLKAEQFRSFVSEMLPLLCELCVVNSREVRERVRDVLLEQVAPLVGVPMAGGVSMAIAEATSAAAEPVEKDEGATSS